LEQQELKYDTAGRHKTVRYATKERMAKVNPKNLAIYDRYLRSNISKNKDVASTTYKTYQSYFNIWLCFIMEKWDNFDIINDTDVLENDMIDIMEDYMVFLQDELHNGKKVINTKLSAVSSFYIWAVKRGKVRSHPFDGKLDRMKGAQDEKIISVYFLDEDDCERIDAELDKVEKGEPSRYDWQDLILWSIAYDSAARIGALHRLSLSSLDMEARGFKNIREKRGKMVTIPFSEKTKERLKKYFEYRELMGVDCDELFFSRYKGEWRGLSVQSLTVRVRKIGEIIGVGDFRPHCIRKTRLNQVGQKNINLAKELAHHASLETTSRFYMKRKDESEVLKEINELM
jgi:integrase/recombinase XerC